MDKHLNDQLQLIFKNQTTMAGLLEQIITDGKAYQDQVIASLKKLGDKIGYIELKLDKIRKGK